MPRYDSPEYVKDIKNLFEEKFPNSVPKDFIIEYCMKFFWETIKKKMVEEESVTVVGFGKFMLEGRYNRSNHFQYYPKLKFSRHFLIHIRGVKGTATEAELKELKQRRAFMEEVWTQRKKHMLSTRSKLPSSLANYTPTYYPQLDSNKEESEV